MDYPVAEVRDLFDPHGIEVCFIEGDEHPGDLDLVVALGGDGTVLRAFARFPQRPVLAINFGTVGFLTAGDRKDLARIVQLLVDGQYFVSERLVLSCRHPCGESLVFNEVTLRAHHKMLSTDVFVDDAKIRTIRGDGVVVGTPTGSTGLLLSMGAPLVMPEVRCMLLDGINEYNFTSRTLILPAEKRVTAARQSRDRGQPGGAHCRWSRDMQLSSRAGGVRRSSCAHGATDIPRR